MFEPVAPDVLGQLQGLIHIHAIGRQGQHVFEEGRRVHRQFGILFAHAPQQMFAAAQQRSDMARGGQAMHQRAQLFMGSRRGNRRKIVGDGDAHVAQVQVELAGFLLLANQGFDQARDIGLSGNRYAIQIA